MNIYIVLTPHCCYENCGQSSHRNSQLVKILKNFLLPRTMQGDTFQNHLEKKNLESKMATHSDPPSSQTAEDVHSVISASSSTGKRPYTINGFKWEIIDSELKRMLSPVSDLLNSDSISTTEAANLFSSIVHEHLHAIVHVYLHANRVLSNCIYDRCRANQIWPLLRIMLENGYLRIQGNFYLQ